MLFMSDLYHPAYAFPPFYPFIFHILTYTYVQIKDYHLLVDQISRVLRPGGLIDVSEFDFYTYDKHHQRVEVGTHEIGPPWISRWMSFIRVAIKHIGGHTDAATHLHEWITSNPLFEDIVYREFWLPIVAPPPHPNESEATRRLYANMKENITVCC